MLTALKLPSAVFAAPLAFVTVICPVAVSQPSEAVDTAAPARCLSGYPDGSFRGDRPVTRNEFAAGTHACLDATTQLLPFKRADYATKADLQGLIERQQELNQQIRDLNDRVDPAAKQPNSQP